MASILRWLDPSVTPRTLRQFRDDVLGNRIKMKGRARAETARPAEMVPAQQLTVMTPAEPPATVETGPREIAFPVEVEPQRLAAVRRRVELVERFYEDRALTVHEVQLGIVRELMEKAAMPEATPTERAKFTEQAVKLLNGGALERSLGEAASYGNVQRAQQKQQGGGRSLIDMNFVVMPTAQVPTNHTLPVQRKSPALIESEPGKE
jgi:hypothetical protein